MKTAIAWFEIPVVDFDRAMKFYSSVIGEEVKKHDMPNPDMLYGVFPYDEGNGIGGALVKMEGCNPSADGTTIYIDGGDDLSPSLARAQEAGAQIIMPKTDIGENGFIAQFIDTEGNRVALHSMS